MNRFEALIFTFVILILSLGCVSAHDNATADGISDYNYSVDVSKTYSDTHLGSIRIYEMPDDASGNISIEIDEKPSYNQKVSLGGNFLVLNELNLSDGIHSALIKYSGDGKYAGFAKNATFEKNFLRLSFEEEDFDGEIQLRSKDSPIFYVSIDKGTTGSVKVSVDGKSVLNKKCNDDGGFDVYVKNIQYGLHTYEVSYTGGNHKSQVKKGSFNLSYYFRVSADKTNISITDKVKFYVDFVDDAKLSYNLSVNGKTSKCSADILELSDFILGENIVEFTTTYNGLTKTIPVTVNLSPLIKVPDTIHYQKPDEIVIIVDNNTKGKLNIMIDSKFYASVDVNQSKTAVVLDNLSLGNHTLTLDYTGVNGDLMNFSNFTVNIIPAVPTTLWAKHTDNLTFTAPAEINGILKLTGMVNMDVEVKNGTAIIPLNNINPGKYKINITYKNTTWQYDISIYRDSPDWDMQIDCPPTIHCYEWMTEFEAQDFSFTILNQPDGLTGSLRVYHDGKYCFEIDDIYYSSYDFEPKFSQIGNHTLTIVYNGNEYFKPCNKTVTYRITDYMDVYFQNNYLYAVLPYNASGSITINVDGEKFNSTKLVVDEKYDEYGLLHHTYNLNGLKKDKSYDVEVIYNGNYGRLALKETFIKDTNIYLVNEPINCNEYPVLNFRVPEDIKNIVDVTIDSKKFIYSKNNQDCYVNISKLKPGWHNITLSYSGDSTYPSKTINDTFLVYSKINYPPFFEYEYKSKLEVSLKLPSDATGSLFVDINNTPYASAALKDGKASIPLLSDDVGEYEFVAYYRGNYEVDSQSNSITIIPKILHTGNARYPDSGLIRIDMPGRHNATLVIYAEDYPIAQYEFDTSTAITIDKDALKNSRVIAQTLLSDESDYSVALNFKAQLYINGKYSTAIFWYSEYAKRLEAKNIKMTYNDATKYQIRAYDLFGDAVGSGEKITVRIDSKKYTLKTDARGIASLKIKQAPGKYSLKISYGNLEITKKITVKHALTLKIVKVKKSAKKIVLTAKLNKKLKGKKITFKFNGKTYTAKTNKKGIAKVTVKKSQLNKLKVGKKVKYQATYLKDTVKKSAKVKS